MILPHPLTGHQDIFVMYLGAELCLEENHMPISYYVIYLTVMISYTYNTRKTVLCLFAVVSVSEHLNRYPGKDFGNTLETGAFGPKKSMIQTSTQVKFMFC